MVRLSVCCRAQISGGNIDHPIRYIGPWSRKVNFMHIHRSRLNWAELADMPSSVGHILAGFAVTRVGVVDRSDGSIHRTWPFALLAATPDLDVLIDVFRRRRIDYTHRRSHSLGAALAAGAATGLVARALGGRFLAPMIRGTASYTSHLLLDYFGKDAADGLPLLWPVSEHHFAADRPLFRTIYTTKGHFLTGLMTRRNVKKIGREIGIIAPFALAAACAGRIRATRL